MPVAVDVSVTTAVLGLNIVESEVTVVVVGDMLLVIIEVGDVVRSAIAERLVFLADSLRSNDAGFESLVFPLSMRSPPPHPDSANAESNDIERNLERKGIGLCILSPIFGFPREQRYSHGSVS